jgi:mannosyltransferase OCH1-like enzyme
LNPGLRSDALRLEILHRYGGVYLDIDMFCVQKLTPLMAKVGNGIAIGFSNTDVFEVNNAVIIS